MPDLNRNVARRTVLGFLIAAPTLMVAARASAAVLPSPPEPADVMDLGDLQDEAAMPTMNLITVVINTDNTVGFAMPRTEVGQGISTSIGMLIAEELEVELSQVHVTLEDANPLLYDNQLTGGSNTTRSLYTPVRTAAAIAKEQLLLTAATQMGVDVSSLTAKNGIITAASGRTMTYGSLAQAAAVTKTRAATPMLKSTSDFTMVGTPQNRTDAMDIVMGKKVFAMDLEIPGAMPTMLCRPPTIGGSVSKINNVYQVHNMADVLAMPGILGVAVIPTSATPLGVNTPRIPVVMSGDAPTAVAVRGRTMGQCIDAIRALKVTWTAGPEDTTTEDELLAKLVAAGNAIPAISATDLGPAGSGLGAKTIDRTFSFMFNSNSPLETGSTVATVKGTKAELWSCLKVPIDAQSKIAMALGIDPLFPVHVVNGGGSFGRHLFFDSAFEAIAAAQAFQAPVRLMWSRTDDHRQGRVHPMSTTHVTATYAGDTIAAFQQRHASLETDFSHGFGSSADNRLGDVSLGATALAQTIFLTTANVPYNYGVTSQLLNETDANFHTGSLRNIYSPDVCVGIELVTDELAAAMGMDPYTFRRKYVKNDPSDASDTTHPTRATDVLDAVAKKGNWGRTMPAGTAQGIAFHAEYKGVCACLVEIDCTPATVNRQIRDAMTGPRVTKVVFAVDVGLCINPRGLEAQMQGGIMDGIAHALTCSMHFDKGFYAEGSWDNNYYTRQWNVPPEIEIIIMPTTTGKPGGAGEFGVAASKAAIACAYARATGTMPTKFPINHDGPLGFEILDTIPPTPQSPTDGLTYAR